MFTSGLAGLVLGEYKKLEPRKGAPELSEREVLRLVARGMEYKDTAVRLSLSHRTVQNHVQNTLNKLQWHNRVELTRYALNQGLEF